jgi:WhiB family redox-sensing transcriptional regulator
MTDAPADWRSRGACRTADPGLFFGHDGETADVRDEREEAAKTVCRRCPVRSECLSYAVAKPETAGVWGGMGEDERARYRRRLLRRAQPKRQAARAQPRKGKAA